MLRTSAAFVLENRFPAALVWGADLVTIYNDAFRPILGEKPEALGRSFADIWSEVWDDIGPIAERAFAGESTFIEDFELTIHRHGRPEKAWFTFSYSPVRAADGTIVGMIDTVVETTATVQSQASLLVSQEQFEALLNQAPMGVYLVDGDFVIRQVNPVALPVFGDIPGGPVDRDFDEIIHILWDKDYADELVRIFRHTLETGEPYVTPERAEYRVDRNITEYYEWRLDRIPLPSGRDGVVCYFRDISPQVNARKEVEEQREVARQSEGKFAALFDNMAEGFALFGVARSPGGQVADLIYREANKALEDQTGLDRTIVVGQPLSAFLTPADAERWTSIFARAVDPGEPVILEDYSETVDRWYSVSAYPHGEDAIAVFYRDITERKRAETVLIENDCRRAFLLTLSDALRPLGEPFAVQVEAMRVIGQHLAVNRAQYHEMEPDDEWIRPGGGYANGVQLHPAPSRMDDFGAFVRDAYEAGQTLIVTDTEKDARVSDDLRVAWVGIGVRAFVAVPLVKNGRLVAVLGLDNATPRSWSQAEIGLVEEVAERTWAAVERARAEETLQDSEGQFRAFLDTSPAFIWHNDPSGQNLFANRYFVEFAGGGEAVVTGSEWQMLIHPDEQDAYVSGYLDAVRNRRPWSDRARALRHDGQWRWLDNKAEPLFDGAGKYLGHVGVSTDVTVEVESEDALRDSANHQALLLAELQHRVRNSLTIIRSLTRRTAENSNDVDDYVRHLDGRLSALARVQTVLSRDPGKGINLHAMVMDELTSQATMPAQYDIDGPEMILSAKAAEVLSLAIHELVTNSIKYGVLGELTGAIRIRWTVNARDGQDWLCFTWNEPVNSKIARPERTGFGSELIRSRVPYELRGTGDIRISADEVEATIDFPLTSSPSKFDSLAAQGT